MQFGFFLFVLVFLLLLYFGVPLLLVRPLGIILLDLYLDQEGIQLVVAILFTVLVILLLVVDLDSDVDFDIDVIPTTGTIVTSNEFKASRVVGVRVRVGKRR